MFHFKTGRVSGKEGLDLSTGGWVRYLSSSEGEVVGRGCDSQRQCLSAFQTKRFRKWVTSGSRYDFFRSRGSV